MKVAPCTVTVNYVHNPEAVAEAKRLMAFYERRYLQRRADEAIARRASENLQGSAKSV